MPVAPADWSAHQLTQFLSAISGRAEQRRAIAVGVERAAEALEAEVGAFVHDGVVVSSVGFPAGQVPELALIAAAEAGGGAVDLPYLGPCQSAVVRMEGPLAGKLILARIGDDAFTGDELNLLAGMMRLLQLNDRMLAVIERERAARDEAERQVEVNAGLLASLEERHRLLERLSKLQRSISHRDPLPDVLDAVTAGASELFGTDVEVSLRLFDPKELVAPGHRSPPQAATPSPPRRSADRVAGWRAIANEALAIVDLSPAEATPGELRTAMAAPVYQEGKVVGSLVVASRRVARRYSGSEQEALLAFAEHASLALTDAATIDAVRRQTRLLALLEAVAVSANEAATIEEAVQTCLDRVCAYTGWPIAYAYFQPERPAKGATPAAPVPSGCSHLEGTFLEACPGLEQVGLELAARVLRTRRPVWVADVATLLPEGTPARTTPACQETIPAPSPDVAGAFSFPVMAGREAVAALEFFSIRADEPSPELRESLAQVGTQLGRVVERSRAAAVLQDTTERTRRIIEAATDAFVSIDSSDTITGINRAAEMTFGHSREEAVGRSIAETIIAPSYRAAYEQGLKAYLAAEGEPASLVLELMAAHRDGHEFPIEAAIWPVRGSHGWEFNAFARDISARKRAQQELAAARDASEEASRLKTEFLATMSHEIRTPMNGILGMTRLLLDTTLDTDQRECAEAVERSAQALLMIINDILDISKIEAGRLELEAVDFDLAAVMADVTELLAPEAREKGLELTSTIAPDIPSGLRGDPGRLRQVLTNLVGNAVKFTDRGSVSVSAYLADAPASGFNVGFDVVDTGIGIPEQNLPSIFEAFRQADASTTRRFGGTGLGLAITRELVTRMGGEISVESEPGRGSRFSFSVRLARAAGVVTAPSREPVARPGPVEGARILIVEDNLVNQRILVKSLERAGYGVEVAPTGLAAVEAASRSQYDAILMDCQMPEMDGFEATRRVRLEEGSGRHTPIIAITASAMRSDRDRCLAAGMDDFIPKPVNPGDLLVTLGRWVGPARPPAMTAPRGAGETRTQGGEATMQAGEAAGPRPENEYAATGESFDVSALRDLRLSLGPGGDAAFQEIVDAFLGDTLLSLDWIQSAAAAREPDQFARAVHRLRGSAASFRAERLAGLCSKAEQLARAGDLARASGVVPLIRDEVEVVSHALQAELAEAG